MKFLVKRPSEMEEFSFTATFEEIEAGLETGKIKADWAVKRESDGYWITTDQLIYGSSPSKSSGQLITRKGIVKLAAIVFVLSCLFPPWQFTADRNGNGGFHSHNPAGYSLIFTPPKNPSQYEWNGVQIDFGRLFIEWASIITLTGLVLFFRSAKESNPIK